MQLDEIEIGQLNRIISMLDSPDSEIQTLAFNLWAHCLTRDRIRDTFYSLEAFSPAYYRTDITLSLMTSTRLSLFIKQLLENKLAFYKIGDKL